MSLAIRYKSLKELRFYKPDGDTIALPVPHEINQSLLSKVVRSEYLVLTVAAGRSIAESEVSTLRAKGNIVGFLIPGQAILSPDQLRNSDPFFGAYALIAAMEVCDRSLRKNYDLSPHSVVGFEPASSVFHDDVFYLVVWLKKLGVSADGFLDDYFVSLARHGVFRSVNGKRPLQASRALGSYDQVLHLSQNAKWPSYVRTIISELEPFAEDPFLRFFYLYQVIETLMSENYKSELAAIRVAFDAQSDISITQLREYVEKFQRIYKEKSRINSALQPICSQSRMAAEAILSALGEDFADDTFGEVIYKVRNIVFHDYQRVHPHADLVADLEENLLNYILEKKLA